jgi:hypothetical protein
MEDFCMTDIDESQLNDNGISEKQWKSIYKLGAVTTIIVLIGTVLDIVIGNITGGDLSRLPSTAIGRFAQFQDNWLLGLYNLDLLNITIQIFFIPGYFALYAAHRKVNNAIAGLGFIFFLVGTTIFVSANTALTMFELSGKYAVAATETQKNLLAAAGEAMLAKGAHGSPGVFIGFILPNIAVLIMGIAMLSGKIFSKANAWFGIAGSILILAYLILVTFVPAMKTVALVIVAPGGIMLMIWMIMFTVKLFKLGRS